MSSGWLAFCTRCERKVPVMDGDGGLRLRFHQGADGTCPGSGHKVIGARTAPPANPAPEAE